MRLITTILNKKFELCLFNYLLNIPTRFGKIRPVSRVVKFHEIYNLSEK
jgi:hypothetical protein